MTIFRCNSCGAMVDTEAEARRLQLPPSAEVKFVVSRCGNCGSTDIAVIKTASRVAGIRPASPDECCGKCGAEMMGTAVVCQECRKLRLDRVLIQTGILLFGLGLLWIGLAVNASYLYVLAAIVVLIPLLALIQSTVALGKSLKGGER